MMTAQKALITGITGQDGSYLADFSQLTTWLMSSSRFVPTLCCSVTSWRRFLFCAPTIWL